MKTVIVSDLHSQRKTLQYLKEIIDLEKPDAIICAGDITTNSDKIFLLDLFDILENNKIDGYFIWGNADEEDIKNEIKASKYNSHLVLRKMGDFKVFGISLEEDISLFNPEALKGSIVLTHRPPISSMLNEKRNNSPLYHISGHLHRSAYFKDYKATKRIQVPTLQFGQYVIFVPDEDYVEFKKIV